MLVSSYVNSGKTHTNWMEERKCNIRLHNYKTLNEPYRERFSKCSIVVVSDFFFLLLFIWPMWNGFYLTFEWMRFTFDLNGHSITFEQVIEFLFVLRMFFFSFNDFHWLNYMRWSVIWLLFIGQKCRLFSVKSLEFSFFSFLFHYYAFPWNLLRWIKWVQRTERAIGWTNGINLWGATWGTLCEWRFHCSTLDTFC